jgi:lipopolysaccharide export system protein LptA
VDHIVVSGAVELEEPGRRGSGDKLVYTAEDRTFVLTGTKAVPPKVVDEAQGTVTGAALRFRSGDDSVEVLSGDGAQKVRTETRMKQKE